jgi:hypothetical protein
LIYCSTIYFAGSTASTNLSAVLTCSPSELSPVFKTATTVAKTADPLRLADTTAIWPTFPVRPVASSGTIAKTEETSARSVKSARSCSRNGLNVSNVKATPFPLVARQFKTNTKTKSSGISYFSTKSGLYPVSYVSLKRVSFVVMKRPLKKLL